MLVDEGVKARNVNGILGLLCREHFPGLVWKAEGEDPEPATSFDHYALVANALDANNREFRNKADRVIMELWVSLSHTTFLNSSHSLDILENKIMDTSCLYAGHLQMPGGTGGMGVSGGLCFL
jgi:hypothetical protein